MPLSRRHATLAALAAAGFAAAPAAASPVTLTLNDADQRYNTPAGQSLLIRSITWLPESGATHEMLHLSPSGFGASIQVFKPANSDSWSPSLLTDGFFLAADAAMPPALAMSLTNSRVDWRDLTITGELVGNDDAAAWAAALNDPSLASETLEAVTLTLNDANPSFAVPAGQRFVTQSIFFHLDGGANDRQLFFTNSGGGLMPIDLDNPITTPPVTFAVEPGNDRVARFQSDPTSFGFTGFTLDDGSGADYVDVSISGFLIADAPQTSACAIPSELVGDWTLLDITIQQGAMIPPDISDTSGFTLSIECDGSYEEDATGGMITAGPDFPAGMPYTTCTYLAGGSTGMASMNGAQIAFAPASMVPDQMDCGYTQLNSFAVHVHEGAATWSYQVVGDELTLSTNLGPNTISMIWER